MSDNTLSSLNEAFKYVQDSKLKNLTSNFAIIQDLVPMKENDKLGRKFLMPVALTFELGFTVGDGTVYALNDAVAAVYDEIEVDPTPVSLRTRVSQSAANRWKDSKKAVINNVALRAGQMKKSLQKFAEIEILHGRTGIATLTGVSDDASGTCVCTVSDATWASGIFAGMVGAKLDAYTSTTKQNSTGDLTISAVDHDAKTVTVTGANADTAAIDANSVLYFKGAYGAGQHGIKTQLDNASTLFGIDASSYDLWKAVEHSVSGALTMPQILKGQAKCVNRGGLDEDVILFLSPTNFEGLNADLSALVDMDPKVSKGEIGFSSITYKGQAGKIHIVSHPYMMDGDAFSIPKSCMRRVGATDIDFMQDEGGRYWRSLDVSGYAGYQCTGHYEFQVIITEPAKCCFYKSITPA